MDDIITSNILRDKIWDNQVFQTRIFEFQNLVRDTTFLSEIIKNNPDIKYDIDVEIRYDFYSLLPKNIKEEILKKI